MSLASIKLDNVQKSFGEGHARTQVLFDISLELESGQFSMIIGPSGCGKTTLINIIGGILEADSGSISVFNKQIDAISDDKKTEFRKTKIGFIFQQYNLIPTITARENIAIPLLINKYPMDKVEKIVEEMVEKVGIKSRAGSYPRDLSGGEQQRVAIARSLIMDPDLVICDEPTSSLDGKTGTMVVALLKNIALQPHKSVIVVTHDTRIFKYADRIIKMEDGRIKSSKLVKREGNK